MTEGVTEGVPVGVDCADVVSLSSLKSPLGILNFCTDRKRQAMRQTDNEVIPYSDAKITLNIEK